LDRMVSFVDFGPTVLSLAGVPVPKHMQGVPYLGSAARAPRKFIHGYRDRMDERYDMVRMVRDRKYKYIRNYMPQLPYFHHQHVSYMYQMPTMQVWQRLADEGKLTGPTATFMAQSKPMEELYDTEADPWEVTNLADSKEHQKILEELRTECRRWQTDIIDLGLMPEADLRTRFGKEAPYTAVRAARESYPLSAIAAAADLANERDAKNLDKLVGLLEDTDPAIRYWAAVGLGSLSDKLGEKAAAQDALQKSLADPAGAVRVAAADALCRFEAYTPAAEGLGKSLKDENEWVRLQAINVVDRIDRHASSQKSIVEACLNDSNDYVKRVAAHTLEGLK
jgi:N-sulfoglucosamine sulfohydrolase